MLKAKGLNSVGNKQELIERLQTAMSESSGDLSKFEEDDLLNVRKIMEFYVFVTFINDKLLFQDDELDEEKSLLDSTHDEILKSPSESTKSTSPEIPPSKPISLKRNISIVVPVVETKPSEEPQSPTEASSGEPDKKVIKISELTAKDRLDLRAKKFAGVTTSSGNSSESDSAQDKLKARAARFGVTAPAEKTAAAAKTAVTSTVSLEVLKKRAERFGTVVVPELKKVEVEEKLQKRQERFGASEKVPITGPTTVKSELEEKALKRLERFKTTSTA